MALYLVTYDVATSDEEGAARLRRVAKVCESCGRRVQQSVFECVLTDVQKQQFLHRLLQIIDEDADSLRVYRITQPLERNLEVFGLDHAFDFEGPLIF